MDPTDLASLSVVERIDGLCDRFEADWQAGRTPRIEDFLQLVAESERRDLWHALLLVEFELLRKSQKKIDPSTYQQRFPFWSDQVAATLAEAASYGEVGDRSGLTISTAEPTAETSVREGHTPSQTESHPAKLGRFEIQEVLGEGAFGTVYRARDPHLDRDVALKVPREGALKTADDRERFLREAKASATLTHPAICPIYEVGSVESRDYIVMAYIEGKTLARVLKSGKIQARQAAGAVRKIALALDEAHQQGIVHRDIKPANIMINTRGEPVIMDFGLARRQKLGDARLTHSGMIMGSPAYMSPEQARGDTEVIGPASDIYSLGVVLYELLTGRRPFEGTVTEVLSKILHFAPDPPSKHRSNLDPELEAICLKAMAKLPADRYQSMKDFATALQDYLKRQAAGATMPQPPSAQQTLAEADETNQFAAALAVISEQHRTQTQEAVESALLKRFPRWQWLASSAVTVTIVLLGILFFARGPTTTVLINVDVDTRDPALTFFLDGASIEGEALGKPIELLEGKHELLVKKDGKTFRRYELKVKRGEKQAAIVLKEREPDAKEPNAKPTAVSERAIAEQILTHGGTVRVATPDRIPPTLGAYYILPYISRVDQLPPEPYHVVGIDLKLGSGTDDYLQLISSLKHLKLLWLLGDEFTDAGLRHLSHHKELLELWLECRQITDAGMQHVGTLAALEVCTIRLARITDAGLKHLAPLKQLNHLQISQALLTGSGLEALSSMKKLTWLSLWENPNLTELQHLSQCQGLTELNLEAAPIGDVEVRQLKQLSKLKFLSLARTNITGAALDELSALPDLAALSVNDTNLTDAEMGKLQQFPALVDLSISRTRLGNAGVETLAKLTGLHTLALGSTRFDDEGMKHLGRMVGLQSLSLIDVSRITDAGIGSLNNLKKLTSLILDGTNITDACVEDLGKLKSLNGLHLNRTAISPAGLWQLRRLLPKTQISPTPPKTDPGERAWIDLFNGQDLTGWEQGPGDTSQWRVENGRLVGSGERGLLFTKQANFTDFQLRAEVLLDEQENSGIFLRSPTIASTIGTKGYEVELNCPNRSGGQPSGTVRLYPPEGQGFILASGVKGKHGVAEWIKLEVTVVGKQFDVRVNEQPELNCKDATLAFVRGHLALQHVTPGKSFQFRRIQIRDLSDSDSKGPEWVSLFNGKDLTGWKQINDNYSCWSVKEGVLIGSGVRDHLFTEKDDFEDFHLQAEARINAAGNGGLLFRSKLFGKGPTQGQCYEADINGDRPEHLNQNTGGLIGFGQNTGTIVERQLVPPGQWFVMDVIAQGNRIRIKVNGETTVDFLDAAHTYKRGRLGLEVFHNESVAEYRNIRVKRLKPTPADAS